MTTSIPYGGWLSSPSVIALETFVRQGAPFVVLDTQHGTGSVQDLPGLRAVASHGRTELMVRVGALDAAVIGRALDFGADGVIVPLVETAAQASAAVAASLFPPAGVRSYGPIASHLGGRTPDELDAGSRVYVMIETAQGLERADEIAATPGLSGIFVGPADLAISLGRDPFAAFTSDLLAPEFATLAAACAAHGIRFGAYAPTPDTARRWREYGCTFVPVGSDVALLRGAVTSLWESLSAGAVGVGAASDGAGEAGTRRLY